MANKILNDSWPKSKPINANDVGDGVALTSIRHPPPEALIEKVCRAICIADHVDPDATGSGLGMSMPEGSTYPLWQARRLQAIEAIFAVWDHNDPHIGLTLNFSGIETPIPAERLRRDIQDAREAANNGHGYQTNVGTQQLETLARAAELYLENYLDDKDVEGR